jgi:hypothetical protein
MTTQSSLHRALQDNKLTAKADFLLQTGYQNGYNKMSESDESEDGLRWALLKVSSCALTVTNLPHHIQKPLRLTRYFVASCPVWNVA